MPVKNILLAIVDIFLVNINSLTKRQLAHFTERFIAMGSYLWNLQTNCPNRSPRHCPVSFTYFVDFLPKPRSYTQRSCLWTLRLLKLRASLLLEISRGGTNRGFATRLFSLVCVFSLAEFRAVLWTLSLINHLRKIALFLDCADLGDNLKVKR